MIELHIPASLGMAAGALLFGLATVWIGCIAWSMRSPRDE